MINVRIEKQNAKETPVLIYEGEYQSRPQVGETICIEGKDYKVKSIKNAPGVLIATVKDSEYRPRRFW